MLRIGVIASNHILLQHALDMLCEIDQDTEIKRYSKELLEMSDETRYIPITNEYSCRGQVFDQLIIFEDVPGYTRERHKEAIDYILYRMDMYSYVPKEYQVIIYPF